ncbi:MAG TPA: DUF2127 domain-containing protein, partial [Pseudonocardiaceae bacterium]
QFVGALLLMVIPPTLITGVANQIVTRDMLGDANGTLSAHLAKAADQFTNGSTRWFAIIYLLAHGVIKLVLVWALLKKVLWMFPISVVVLAGFVVYEVWRATNTHSIALPIFAAIDVVIIALIIREYRKLRRERTATSVATG